MSITIREIMPKDKKQILKLIFDFGMYFKDLDPLKRCIVGGKYAQYFYQRMKRMTKNHNGKIYCACEEENIIGFIAGIIRKTSGSDLVETIPATNGYILEFYVDENFRGQGIGQRLMEKIEYYFNSYKCQLMNVDVFAPNLKGINFYKKYGFLERDYHLMKLLNK